MEVGDSLKRGYMEIDIILSKRITVIVSAMML